MNGRLESMKTAAKKVVDAMTFADYVGVVAFDDQAESMHGLTTLAKALPAFRTRIKTYIDDLSAAGGTNFNAGFNKAFELVDASVGRSYAADCHTTHVFLTDGAAASPTSTIQSRQSGVTDEHYFIVSLGSGTEADLLRQLSWDIGGIFSAVPDYEEEELQRALIGFYKYYSLQKTLGKVEGFSWTEPYDSIPMIWGPMTSVSAPVYDKTREPWHMIGVASVDATVCDLRRRRAPVGAPRRTPQTVRGCTCKLDWTYNGQTFNGCSDVDWPVPWCAVQDGCGSGGTELAAGPTDAGATASPPGRRRPCAPRCSTCATSWCARPMLLTCHRARSRRSASASTVKPRRRTRARTRTWRTTSGPSTVRTIPSPVEPSSTSSEQRGPSPARRTTWTWELPVRRRHDSHVRARRFRLRLRLPISRWTPIWPSSSPPSSPPSSFAASLDTRRVGAGVRISPLTPTWTRRVISARNSSNKAGCRWRNTGIREPPPGRVRAPAGGVRAAPQYGQMPPYGQPPPGHYGRCPRTRSTASGAVRTDASDGQPLGRSVSAAAVLSGDSLSWSGRRGDAR